MKHLIFAVLVFPSPLSAEQTRSIGAHVHGSGTIGIAFSGSEFSLSLEAPGADIVGFEHAAENSDERDLVQAAISDLADPLRLFSVSDEAGCTVKSADVTTTMQPNDGHVSTDDHSSEAAGKHETSGHSEFHAEYVITCQNIDAIDGIGFEYFKRFPNARELDVQVVTSSGAQAYEVERSAAYLDLRGIL